jgi:hypothetical protein
VVLSNGYDTVDDRKYIAQPPNEAPKFGPTASVT